MKHSERFVGVPVTLNRLIHQDLKSLYLEVYISIRSFVSLSPRNDNFCFCFPSIEVIAKKFALSEEDVQVGVAWLENNGYLYRRPRGRRSTTYTIVLERDQFLLTMQNEGLDPAIEEYEAWMERQRNLARLKKGTSAKSRRSDVSQPP